MLKIASALSKQSIKKLFFTGLIFFCCMHNVFAVEIEITGKEVETFFTGEYNRGLSLNAELSAAGGIELNNLLGFKGGFSIGAVKGSVDIKTFLNARIAPWEVLPLDFFLAWNYNGLPGYGAHSNTIIPMVSYSGKRAGIILGVGLRFTSFFHENAIFESVISFSGYVNVYNNDFLGIRLTCANFNDFYTGNMGSYSFGVNGVVSLREQWSIISDIIFRQSGSVGLAANFYGITFRTGAKYSW